MPRKVPLPPSLIRSSVRTAAAGLSRGRLRGRDVDHPFHGVSSVGLDISDIMDACTSFLPLLRRGDVFSHATAALLYGAPLPREISVLPLHIGNAAARQRRMADVVGHRFATSVRATMFLGFPTVAPADAWCQLSNMLSREDLVAVGDYLVSGKPSRTGHRIQPLCSLDELAEAAARHGSRRGATALAWALPRVRTGVDSRPESLLRLLMERAGLPEPVVHPPVIVDGGRRVLHPDLAIVEWRRVFEYEGVQHFRDERQWRHDVARFRSFEAAGWGAERVTSLELFENPRAYERYLRARSLIWRRDASNG